MANIWLESCQGIASTTDWLAKGYINSESQTFDDDGSPRGTGIVCGGKCWLPLAHSGTTVVVGLRHRRKSSNETYMPLGIFTEAVEGWSKTRVSLWVTSDGSIVLRNGLTGTILVQSSTGLVGISSWHYFEIEVTIHPTAGVAKLWVDGTLIGTATNADTAGDYDETTTWSCIWLYGNDSSIAFCDLYVNDGSGDAPDNTAWGDVLIDQHLPNGNGASDPRPQYWDGSDGNAVNNYQLVDETTPNRDTDYVEADTVDDLETYAFENLKQTGCAIKGMQLNIWHTKANAGSATLRAVCRPSSTDRVDATDISPAYGNYLCSGIRYPVNPDNSSAWDETGFNATEWGMKRAA